MTLHVDLLGTREHFVVDVDETFLRDVRVRLRGADRRVTKQFLDDSEISPVVQHMSSETVS
jgi:hypothetical protein